MNADTNGIMVEPLDTAVRNGQDGIPEPNKINSESLPNGTICENSNITEDGNLGNRDLLDLPINNSDDALSDSKDNETNNADDPLKDSQDVKVNIRDVTSVDLLKDNSNDGSLGGKQPQEMVLADKANCNVSLGISHNMETNTSDDVPHLSKQGNSINGLKSNHNVDEESSDCDEDTVGDTVSSGETEVQYKENVDNRASKLETFKIVTIKRNHSDEEMGSTNSDYTGSEGEPKAEDTVGINSDSDVFGTGEDTHDIGELNKSDDVILLEYDGTDNHNGTCKSPEVYEIGSDNSDCVVTAVDKVTKKTDSAVKTKKRPKANDTKMELRRSSRKIKRIKYDSEIEPHEESDIEEVSMEDPLKHKSNHIIINNTNALVEMAARSKNNQKKGTTVVIIDSPVTTKSCTPVNKSTNSTLSQNIYQRIASRGTSVTSVTTKNVSTQATQVNPPAVTPILPTLTDEMFVVEAPSFIVPYVYEKPAVVPFKDFVDKWGKEIEEENAKEEKLLLEKKKEEKAKRDKERKEKRERGEEFEESDEEVDSEEMKKKKAVKAEKKERRRHKKEDDDVSWDGSSSEESEDDSISDDDRQTIILKDKPDNIDAIKDISTGQPSTTSINTKSGSYFDLCLGKFFMNIGLNLVQEYVQTDLLHQQNRKLQREIKSGHDTKNRKVSIALLTKNLEMSQETNAPFLFEQKKCKLCTFKTESALAMAHHLETPHMKNNLYKCNHCIFEIRNPHDILYHMETEHNVKAKLERTPALHQCPNCPFEDHGKGKLARHLIACAKKFKPETNLAPPLEWEHPAKIAKFVRARNSMGYPAQFGRHHVDSASFNVRIPIANAMAPVAYRPFTPNAPRAALTAPRASAPAHHAAPRATTSLSTQPRPSSLLIRQGPTALPTYPIGNTKKSMHHSISITALPRQSGPMQPLPSANAKGFVMCEICDGYIKDLDQLRNHMQWIHKVKIHPKMIYNRPPLNCQKCQFRFFTDQGLERHLLGSHGLVTSSIQEAANKGKDAGRCPVCGRVYQWKLLGHVSRDHNLVLKPAHLSYKCTVCTATFGMYRQFENHVYSAHSIVAKKVMDKKTSAAAAKANANDNAAKQLKINDEITIIAQPMKLLGPPKGKRGVE